MGKNVKVQSSGVVLARGVDVTGQNDAPVLLLDSDDKYTLVTVRDGREYIGVWMSNKRIVKALRKAGVIE